MEDKDNEIYYNYCKVTTLEDKILINELVKAAILYMKNKGINESADALYSLALKMLVLHWHDNREVIGKADKLAFSLESILFALKYGAKK
ncbi:MAG: head-tail connector protein [Clostridia bacterium]